MKTRLIIKYLDSDGQEKTLTTFKDLKRDALHLVELKRGKILSIKAAI
jgi:hypothetical protein